MKLCKDCKHEEDGLSRYEFCTRLVRVESVDLRDGTNIMGGWRSTLAERKHGAVMARLTGTCGIDGRFWEAKP